MQLNKVLLLLLVPMLLPACQGSLVSMMVGNSYPTAARNYVTAGFANKDEVQEYAAFSDYFAFKISGEEWRTFYNRFPEYWKDLQSAKAYTFMSDYNSGYTAYALKWNQNEKKKEWSQDTLNRLQSRTLTKGDDIYQITFAYGAPKRVIWDNDFDIMAYDDNHIFLLKDNHFDRMTSCKGCTETFDDNRGHKLMVMGNNEVLSNLGLDRPTY